MPLPTIGTRFNGPLSEPLPFIVSVPIWVDLTYPDGGAYHLRTTALKDMLAHPRYANWVLAIMAQQLAATPVQGCA